MFKQLAKHLTVMALSLAGSSASAQDKWVHQVSGGGQDLYPGSSNPNFTIGFTAKQDASGRSVGQVTWLSSGEVVAKGVVEDLYVVGNQGFVRYRITHTTVPGVVVGHYIYIGFEDNGEGSGAPPDRHTFIYGAPFAISAAAFADFVNHGGGGFPVEWVHGNVQVR